MSERRIDFYFDGCSAVLHPAGGRHGVVICAGHGYDELCTHRNFVLLADELAEAGFPTLRFDYHGTGQSAGTDLDPDRIGTWVRNIASAVELLRSDAGVASVTLVGYRLGGLLAVLAAERKPEWSEIGDLDLALIEPVLSGRHYIREIQIQASLYPVGSDDLSGDDRIGLSSCGFHLSNETMASLKTIDAKTFGLESVADLLLLSNGIDTESAFVKAIRPRSISCRPFPAISELTVDPIRSLAAISPFADLVAHLEKQHGAPTVPTERAEFLPLATTLECLGWQEQAIRLGDGDRLHAVSCTPTDHSQKLKTVLFLNGGASHSIGWARMTVGIARKLALAGYGSLRLDFNGLGESAWVSSEPVILYNDAFSNDITAAVDWLKASGYDDVFAAGMCSGAHAAFHGAVTDPRLRGAVLTNLLRFQISRREASQVGGAVSFRSTANYLERMKTLDGWKAFLSGGRSKIMGLLAEYGRRTTVIMRSYLGFVWFKATGTTVFAHPVFGAFRQMDRRGMKVLIIYSDQDNGLDELAIHAGPRGSLLKGLKTIGFETISRADHNLTAPSSQSQFADLLTNFLSRA